MATLEAAKGHQDLLKLLRNLSVINETRLKMIGNRCDQIKPVRKIKPTRRSISGVMAFKGLGGVAFESSLERDFLKRMRFSHQVESVISQPVEVPFSDSLGRPQIYTPDYLVFYHQRNLPYSGALRPLLVEVKPREQWVENWRDWSGKWKEARRLARSQGWQFRIYDESRIRGLPLENIVFLERFERMIFDQGDIDAVLNTLREMEVAPVHYLLARHFNGIFRDRGVSLLWHLIATRQVDCDITEPLNHDLELWVPDHETV